MGVQWSAGKSSAKLDTILYYHILHKEFSYCAKVLERHERRWLAHCKPMAEGPRG